MRHVQILELMNEMTIDEKVGQMVQIAGDIFLTEDKNVTTGPLKDLQLSQEKLYQVGSVLNIMGAQKVKKVQDEYLSNSRLKIPLLFMDDIINGYKIAFPIPIAQGCSWNLAVIKKMAQISAMEATVAGSNVNFSPMVDLVRDARWGRVMEAMGGEDSYLGSVYAKTMIGAYQGENIAKTGNLASCVKHMAAYGAVEAGRDYNTVDMSQREFRQYYLPAYQAAIESGAEMIMTSFNTLNGIPATINKWLIQDVLRKELHFKGIVISDYGAIEETINHGVSENEKQAAFNAIQAGVDIDMMSKVYINYLKEWCLQDKEIQSKVNESVLRILQLKNKLGLFENPYGNANEEKEKTYIMNPLALEESKKLTQETFVLLKNENHCLPLHTNQKIALIGPYADNGAITGSWSMFSDRSKSATLLQKLKEKLPQANLWYAKGTEILRENEINPILKVNGFPTIIIEKEEEREKQLIEEAKEIGKKAEVIVLALGEHYKQSGEACSRSNIGLPKNQICLIEELATLKIPMVLVLFNGRPLVLKEVADKFAAILEVWFPGTMGAEAIAQVLLGEGNPSGKLTMSFPQSTGQCPIYYNHYSTGRPHICDKKYLSRYQDIPTESYYPFGYGLSYSKFVYQNLKLDKQEMTSKDEIIVTVEVQNQSHNEGYEVVQLYLQDLFASVVRPVKELKSFQKVYFAPYETKEIKFVIKPSMLQFWNEKLELVMEKGEFKVLVGSNSKDTLEKRFKLVT